MALPDYQTLMLPLLRFASDGKEHTGLEAVQYVSDLFKLAPNERSQLLPSGRVPVINNRTHWALTYLRHAAVLASTSRGRFAITERGRQLLKSKPARIDTWLLVSRYPEAAEFVGKIGRNGGKARDRKTVEAIEAEATGAEEVLSPEEQLETSYLTLRGQVEAVILERLKSSSPLFFEKAVLEVLVAMGYGGSRAEAAEHLGRPGDGGVDGVINEDKLGLDKVYVQAKRWDGTVGMSVIREFVGSLAKEHARKGVLITTSFFVKGARAYCDAIDQRLVLIDSPELVRHMVDHGVGVEVKQKYASYRVDEDFFEEAD